MKTQHPRKSTNISCSVNEIFFGVIAYVRNLTTEVISYKTRRDQSVHENIFDDIIRFVI